MTNAFQAPIGDEMLTSEDQDGMASIGKSTPGPAAP